MRIFVVLYLLFIVFCSGCIAADQKAIHDDAKNHQEASLRWKASELIGYTYTLVDDKAYSIFTFTEDGAVMHTAGQKGGPYTSPLLYWAIDDKGIPNMGGDIGFTSFSWIKPEDNNDKVVVYSEGHREIYIRERLADSNDQSS